MVRKQINPFTTMDIVEFTRAHYPKALIKPTTKHKKDLYIRRTLILLLWESGVKVGMIAKLIGETHANVSIALPKVRAYFTTDGSDLFFELYNEFVEKYNTHTNAKSTDNNEGVQSDSESIVSPLVSLQ